MIAVGQSHIDDRRIDLGLVQKLPMRDASAYYHEPSLYGCKMFSAIIIESKNDSVFSICEGIIASVFDVGDEEKVIIINNEQDLFYTFAQLNFTQAKKGDHVQKGLFIGLCRRSEDCESLFEMFCIVSDKTGDSLPEHKIWEILKNQDDVNNIIAYQKNVATHGFITTKVSTIQVSDTTGDDQSDAAR